MLLHLTALILMAQTNDTQAMSEYNQWRAHNGLRQLVISPELCAAARFKQSLLTQNGIELDHFKNGWGPQQLVDRFLGPGHEATELLSSSSRDINGSWNEPPWKYPRNWPKEYTHFALKSNNKWNYVGFVSGSPAILILAR